MIDPTTTGALVAAALSAGASALAKGAIGQAGKEAYEALKGALMSWAGQDVSKLEERPESESRKAVVAELTDEQSEQERGRIAILAEALVREMRTAAHERGPVAVDIRKLEALQVQLGRITARTGTGFRADEVKADVFRIDEIESGKS